MNFLSKPSTKWDSNFLKINSNLSKDLNNTHLNPLTGIIDILTYFCSQSQNLALNYSFLEMLIKFI